jgi:hypothetical protein
MPKCNWFYPHNWSEWSEKKFYKNTGASFQEKKCLKCGFIKQRDIQE